MAKPDFRTIALDGTAGSGKSSTARLLAEYYNYLYVNTGNDYRALTAYFLQHDVAPTPEAVNDYLASNSLTLSTQVEDLESLIFINDTSFTLKALRSSEVNQNVSYFAEMPEIRSITLEYERSQPQIAKEKGFQGLVAEGRDLTSVVFAETPYRFYLEADLATRVARRKSQGQLDSLKDRDYIDSNRKSAPLVFTAGTYAVDTSHTPLEEVVSTIVKQIQQMEA